jgi:hypothetical protein
MGSVAGDFKHPREVTRKLLSQAQPEGDGATVRRSIGRWVGEFSSNSFVGVRELLLLCY